MLGAYCATSTKCCRYDKAKYQSEKFKLSPNDKCQTLFHGMASCHLNLELDLAFGFCYFTVLPVS